MDADQQVIEFLADKDNIEFAWEVHERFPYVSSHLQDRFWRLALDRLESL